MIYDETNLLNMILVHGYVQLPEGNVVSSIWCNLHILILPKKNVDVGETTNFIRFWIKWVNLDECSFSYDEILAEWYHIKKKYQNNMNNIGVPSNNSELWILVVNNGIPLTHLSSGLQKPSKSEDVLY